MLSDAVLELSKALTQTTELLETNDARALSQWLDSTTDTSTMQLTKLLRFGVSQALSPTSSPIMKANPALRVALSSHNSTLARLDGLLNASLDPESSPETNAKLLVELKTVLDVLGQAEAVRNELLPLLRLKHQQLLAASSSPIFKLVNEQMNDDVIASVSGLMREVRFSEALQELLNRVILPLVPVVTQLDNNTIPDTTTLATESPKKKNGKGKTKKKSSLMVSGMKMTMLEFPSKISTSMTMHADNMLVPGSDVYEPKNVSTSMVLVTSGLSMKIEETFFSYERFSWPRFKRSGHIAIDVDNINLRFGLKASVPELTDNSRPSVTVKEPDAETLPKQHFEVPLVVFETDAGEHDRSVTVEDVNIRLSGDVANHKLLNSVIRLLHGTICTEVNDVLDVHMREIMDHLCILLNVGMVLQA